MLYGSYMTSDTTASYIARLNVMQGEERFISNPASSYNIKTSCPHGFL